MLFFGGRGVGGAGPHHTPLAPPFAVPPLASRPSHPRPDLSWNTFTGEPAPRRSWLRWGSAQVSHSFAVASLQVEGLEVEVARATVFYKQAWMMLMVDTAVSCPVSESLL